MNSLIIVFISFSFALGYRFYSKYISTKIFNLNDKNIIHIDKEMKLTLSFKTYLIWTPFYFYCWCCANYWSLYCSHWGWLPAILWIVIGTVFMGAYDLELSTKSQRKEINLIHRQMSSIKELE